MEMKADEKKLACEFWETIKKQKEEQKRIIEEILLSMAERITEIAQCLKDYTET